MKQCTIDIDKVPSSIDTNISENCISNIIINKELQFYKQNLIILFHSYSYEYS